MKNSTLLISFFIALTLSLTSLDSYGQSTATYNITFNSVWNASDHGTLPANAHWSKLVGATHNSNVTFLEMGEVASPGIEKVAEEGNNDIFNAEVNSSIALGHADQYIDGNSLASATGNITITGLEVDENFPLLTLASMIAPSPDWMIAINGLELRENNSWKTQIVIDLFCYDAGSDNGANYNSPDSDTNPKQPISSLRYIAPFNSEKVGTLTIELQSVLAVENNASIDMVKVFPNPSQGEITISNVRTLDLESIAIYNVLGRLVKQADISSTDNQLSLNLTDLKSGIYLLKLISVDGESKTQKLILE